MSEHQHFCVCACGDHVWQASSRGHVVLASPEDAPLLAKPWNALLTGGVAHARRRAKRERDGKTIFLHKEILPPPIGMLVDHVNHNGLDNRRSNLRLATYGQNQANRRSKRGTSSPFKGVWHYKARNRWCAEITRKGMRHHLGTFHSEMDAALAFDEAARVLDGAFACLNFPGPAEVGALRP